jgi:hypothetical protein
MMYSVEGRRAQMSRRLCTPRYTPQTAGSADRAAAGLGTSTPAAQLRTGAGPARGIGIC